MSCAGMEIGKCDICGKTEAVERKYYHYDINCECHSPNHLEMVKYCKDCEPKEPRETKITFKTQDLKNGTVDYILAKLRNECATNLNLTNRIRTLYEENDKLREENELLRANK